VPEVVIVNSGGGDPASTLRAAGIDVPLVDVAERLLPGAVRNLGIEVTSAPVVAFLAADCIAEPGWAAARLAAHQRGAAVVAGSLTVAPPRTLSACASHLLLHHRVRPEAPPDDRVLALLSYERSVLDLHGPFLEDVLVGEDTDYFDRLEPEEIVEWAPGAMTAHRYPQTMGALLRDQFTRGRVAARHALQLGDRRPRRRIAARNLHNIAFALGRAQSVPDADERRVMLAATPLLVLGAFACAMGVLTARRPGRGSDRHGT
jgi:glycosyltransferase involved in cell wall biosynthesis